MIYLDNAATSFPKPKYVLKNTAEFIKKHCGNSGRGSHKLALNTSEKIYETREAVSDFLKTDNAEKVVFTQNATYALNLAIKTTIQTNCHVLISDIEHNAVLRPLFALKKNKNVKYSIFSTEGDIEKNITSMINPETRYIISTLVSNVTGKEIPMKVLSDIAKRNNLKLIIDASQALGHKDVNLAKNYCDVLCSAGHKSLFGIQGVGFAVFCDDIYRDTIFEGGSGNDSFNLEMPLYLPERFEAGTLSAPSIVSLLYGIKFIENIGLNEIEKKVSALVERYVDIINSINNTTIYGAENGIISFNVIGKTSEYISSELNRCGICVRGGYHCSPLSHKSIGTVESGTVRISLSYFNTIRESDKFYKAIKQISNF